MTAHHSRGGHTILGVRWVDIKKADGTDRSRLVAKEPKTHTAPDLFAATPPIESLKYLLRRAVRDKTLSVMHLGGTHAYLFVDAVCDIYVRLPAEDQESREYSMCAKLNKAINGTRDASQNWQR